MATPVVRLSEWTHKRLERLKRPGETCGDVIDRLTWGWNLMALAGLITDGQGEAMLADIADMRERAREGLDRWMKEH